MGSVPWRLLPMRIWFEDRNFRVSAVGLISLLLLLFTLIMPVIFFYFGERVGEAGVFRWFPVIIRMS